ncbi:MAG: DegV family protein [Bacillota bacterium]|jgi:DegV family protein with EDD domain
MSEIRIFTDTSADLPQELLDKYHIGVVPMRINMAGTDYTDGVTLAPSEFYDKMEALPSLPTTSQPSPQEFVNAFQPELSAGRTVITINLSSELSGTVDSARWAKEALGAAGDNVYVVDSRSASIGLGILVLMAAEMAEQGHSAPEIVERVNAARQELVHIFTLDHMENLVKGGRISRTAGTLGDFLNIKPILHLDDAGRIVLLDKVRGRKKALNYLVDSLDREAIRDKYRYIGVSHAGCPETGAEIAARLQALLPEAVVVQGEIGATIGTHVGRGCIAIFYFSSCHPA